ncbi:MAG: ribonuclease, partial [Alphaproteobacteria bacterium]|nr:ribonuclease [Alphaproteobacteria bacterium]
MIRFVLRAAFAAAVALIVGSGAVGAQDRRQNQPGQFDYYVLALSWSPSFCEVSAERGRDQNEQCGPRPYSFVVHGLWPQYEKGFPEFCQVPAPRLDRNIVSS